MNTQAYYSTFETALGPFSLAVDESGAILATAFGGPEELRPRRRDLRDLVPDDANRAAKAQAQIGDYLAGKRRELKLRLAPGGSAFQQRVWQALQEIPRGVTRTYGDLAKELNSSARAVGRANATNPICLIVPCHRVIGADGSLTGFAFGTEIKERLLALERAAK